MESGEVTNIIGSVPWMAPEMIKQINPGRKADIWSLGCTVVEMLTGKRPFHEYDNATQVMYTIASGKKPSIPTAMNQKLSLECKQFVANCLEENPSDRGTAVQLLQHPFLRS